MDAPGSEQVLDNAIRRGLRGMRDVPAGPFRQRTFDLGVPLVDLTKANALAADQEDEALIARLLAGR